ncbi:unnamed protein product [Peronospora destructor]|uniref:Uncharacterized protein n=1 Tax=Peronospora destructor TaxID=86335 RepID=A0AAV0TQS3_9STRA|nr:unnamed protein product [Peronospora destructor]
MRASERRIGLQEVANRNEAWAADNSHIVAGLKDVDWTDIRTITGATVWATQLLYRIKVRAYSTWDTARTVVGCPLPECRDLGITKAHIWWIVEQRGHYGESFWGSGQNWIKNGG